MAAWLSLKSLVQQSETPYEKTLKDEQEHVTVARALQKYLIKARLARAYYTNKQQPFIPKDCQNNSKPAINYSSKRSHSSFLDNFSFDPRNSLQQEHRLYSVRHCNPHNRIAPPVTVRNAIPVFSAPPLPSPQPSLVMRPQALGVAPPVCVRQAVPIFAASVCKELPTVHPVIKPEDPTNTEISNNSSRGASLSPVSAVLNSEVPALQVDLPSSEAVTIQVEAVAKVSSPPVSSKAPAEETRIAVQDKLQESKEIEDLKGLKI
ncbi:hypothetical protein DH2020_030060 [Rehmannia glutinosa]|uniref:Uncharacterized protein n=1 Tax=Rehmannia glutinosa TaxID=99300 RepID=A0ABR0VPY4_REHGL